MWKKQRKTASFEFASKNLRDFSTVVFREYSLKLAHILSRISLYQQSLDMQDLFMRMTLDSICKVGFGVEIGTLSLQLPENPFARAFDTANIVVMLRFINPLWRVKRFLRIGSEALLNQSIQAVDNFTYSVISKRKAEIEQAKANGNCAQVKQIHFSHCNCISIVFLPILFRSLRLQMQKTLLKRLSTKIEFITEPMDANCSGV